MRVSTEYAEKLSSAPRNYYGGIDNLPEGFEQIGQGCYRTVFRGPDGYAYKIDGRGGKDNAAELRAIEKVAAKGDLPAWCYVPDAMMVGEVLIMEFIPGERLNYDDCYGPRCICPGGKENCWRKRTQILSYEHGLSDLHGGNVRKVADADGKDYTLVVIDLNCCDSEDMDDDEEPYSPEPMSPEPYSDEADSGYCNCALCR